MKIYLNGVDLDTLKAGDKSIKYQDNYLEFIASEGVEFFSDVEIKGRGNSTWGLSKSPYQIKFKKKTDLLGLGVAKKWILLANFVDDSNLRNDVAFKLAEMLNEKYAVKGEFVRLVVDNKYEGLYYLTHKIEISKDSVDLRDPYGILMEIDGLHRDIEDCIDTSVGVCLVVKDVVTDDDETIAVATKQFLDDYNKFEKAVRARDYDTVTKLVDIHSLAEYYLISEFSVNPDAYYSSFFLYKDGEKDKIHVGPVWDFDYAFGNQKWIWSENRDFYSPYEIMVLREELMPKQGEKETGNIALEIYYLMRMPEFRDEVRKTFREKLMGRAEEFLNWVRMRKDLIRKESIIDAEKWEFGGFEEEAEYLLNWVEERFEKFEQEYGKGDFETKNGGV